VASPAEHPALRQIEQDADEMFSAVGIGPFNGAPEDDHLASAAVILVYGTPPLGFACVDLVDGLAHLWQLSVRPDQGRQGIGSELLHAVCHWATQNHYPAVTLTTFRDVPWNAPFYARHGFLPVAEPSPGLVSIRQHEQEIGDDNFGFRIVMRKDLRRTSPWSATPSRPRSGSPEDL
jgi:GNAT superfamily N-acetyltransferase